MSKLKTVKHEFHAPYVQPMYLTEYKGKKFKIQKRELPSTEWDLLVQDLEDTWQCDYEFYHWVETYPTKRHCLDAVIRFVDHGETW